MALYVGSRCVLDGRHPCSVRYVGPTSLGHGTWYGIELEDASLGDSDGILDGTRYFTCARGKKAGRFVQRRRLAVANRSRDMMDISSSELDYDSSTIIRHRRAQSARIAPRKDSLSRNRPQSARNSPEKVSTKFVRKESKSENSSPEKGRRRSKTLIDPREVAQALEESQREKRLQKRARNMTSITVSQVRPQSADAATIQQASREAEMRGEIMRLQKEHLKTLMAENRDLTETNDVLVAHVATLEAKHAEVTLENSRLQGQISGDGDESYSAIVSERDLAVLKLATLTEEFEAFKRNSKTSSDKTKSKNGKDVIDLDAVTDREELDRLRSENKMFRQAVQGEPIDLSDCFPNDGGEVDASAAIAEVHRLRFIIAEMKKTWGPPSQSIASNPDFDNQMSELRTRCRKAEARTEVLTSLIEKMSNQTLSQEDSAAVGNAVNISTKKDRGMAIYQVAERIGVSWDDLDAEVAHQNEALDRSFSLTTQIAPASHGALTVAESFAKMRSRLSGRLQKVLHQSNSIRIRSQALSPASSEATAYRPRPSPPKEPMDGGQGKSRSPNGARYASSSRKVVLPTNDDLKKKTQRTSKNYSDEPVRGLAKAPSRGTHYNKNSRHSASVSLSTNHPGKR